MFTKTLKTMLASLAFAFANNVAAQATPEQAKSGDTQAEGRERTTSFFIAVRPWASRWDVPLTDAQVVIPDPLAPVPVLRLSPVSAQSGTSFVPLMALGIRHAAFTVSLNISPNTGYSTGGLTNGDVHRKEIDFNFGYSLMPNVVAVLAYKSAKIDQVFTQNVETLMGVRSGAKISALLAGLSASAPLQGPLSLYGNVAVGPARQEGDTPDAAGKSKWNGAYTIGEVGLSYRMLEGQKESVLKNLTLQLSYRAQLYRVNDLTYGTYSFPAGVLLATERRDVGSVTAGFLVGLVGTF